MCETYTKSVCMAFTFAETMREKMLAKRLDIAAVAASLGYSFEHIRKLYNSEAFPSRALREAIADLLNIDRTKSKSK